jgi:hypothetical protein
MAGNYTSNPQGFPPLTAPLVDDNGRITQVWMRFFLNLQVSTSGGGGGSVDVDEALAQLGYVFDQDPPDGNTAYLSDFSLEDVNGQDLIALILATIDPGDSVVASAAQAWLPLVTGTTITTSAGSQPVFVMDGDNECIAVPF